MPIAMVRDRRLISPPSRSPGGRKEQFTADAPSSGRPSIPAATRTLTGLPSA